jgi:anti-sigma regulatory factor (Ser/Thr protein kinase)
VVDPQNTVGRDPIGSSPQELALTLSLPPVPRASAEARQGLAVFGESLPAEVFSDLRVIVTELVTNGVKYGPGQAIRVAVTLDGTGLVSGDVDDGGTGGVSISPSPDPAGGGLGLLIVDALTSSWGVVPDSSQVWFKIAALA